MIIINKPRSFFAAVLCLSLILSCAVPASAESTDASGDPVVTATPVPEHSAYYDQAADTDAIPGWPTGPNIEGQAAVVMDINAGAVLYSKDGDTRLYPASITKIMTALLACENLDQSSSFSMSESAAYGIESGSSTIYADTGEVFTMEQGMMALMLESANEMALELAELTSGSVKKFVELMNQRARIIGCTNTHFNNPNGLPDETHYTTASDMALISRAAYSNACFRKYCTTDYYEIPATNVMAETRYLRNHHGMMADHDYAYDGVLGGKTGYTEAAGNTLVTYAQRGSLTVVVVVLNSTGGGYSDTASLLDYAFGNFQLISLDTSDTGRALLPSQQSILGDDADTSAFYYKTQSYATVPVGVDQSILTESQELLANAAGMPRLKTTYYYNDHEVGFGMRYERTILSD